MIEQATLIYPSGLRDRGELQDDLVLGYERLQQAYVARFPSYSRVITVPATVDVPTGVIITNDFPQHGRAAAR